MTALRPPRQSPATAYLQHLNKKRISTIDMIPSAPISPQRLTPRSTNGKIFFPLGTTQRTISEATMATEVSESSGDSNRSQSDPFDPFSIDDSWAGEDCWEPNVQQRVPPPSTTLWEPLDAPPSTSTALVVHEVERSDFLTTEYPCDNDDDSLLALDRLLAETSRRWSETSRQTHAAFCRRSASTCVQCQAEQAALIEAQQAEITALREQLSEQQEAIEVDLPLEQIEVYHDADDQCSVTSGLTKYNDLNSRLDDSASFLLNAYPPARPDADSVTGVNSVQPLRVRHYTVSMTAADGTERKAVYSGPVSAQGVPHGQCGIFKFETGDLYLGDVEYGRMHGIGTYTMKASRKRARVLKGRFVDNVYVGPEE